MHTAALAEDDLSLMDFTEVGSRAALLAAIIILRRAESFTKGADLVGVRAPISVALSKLQITGYVDEVTLLMGESAELAAAIGELWRLVERAAVSDLLSSASQAAREPQEVLRRRWGDYVDAVVAVASQVRLVERLRLGLERKQAKREVPRFGLERGFDR